MSWRPVLLLVSAGAGIIVACSDDGGQAPVRYPEQGDGGRTSTSSSSGGTTSSGGTRPISHDYCGAVMALADKLLSCCTDTEKQENGADNGLQFLKAFYQKFICPTIDASLASGRMRIDKVQEATCVGFYEDAMAKASCPYVVDPAVKKASTSDACLHLYVGTVAENGACKGDHECADGLTCVGWNSDVDGACKKPPALGEACGPNTSADSGATTKATVSLPFGNHPECAPGGYCGGERKCVQQFAQGEFCGGSSVCANNLPCYQEKCGGPGPSDPNGPCLSTRDCKDGLFCTSRDAGACQPRKANGEPCTDNDECLSRCVVPDGGTTGTCTKYCYE